MKFELATGEVKDSIGITHISVQMYGHIFKLSIFVCDLGGLEICKEMYTK